MTKVIGIVGTGPRGLSAMESFIAASQSVEFEVKILLFEKSKYVGCGPVYAPDQSEANWLNISERALQLNNRPELKWMNTVIPSFPSYHEWSNFDPKDAERKDVFPLRGKVGAYLQERFWSMATPLQKANVLQIYNTEVLKVDYSEKPIIVIKNDSIEVDEVLLAIGHQKTKEDDQLSKWRSEVSSDPDNTLIAEPYPSEQIIKHLEENQELSIALRGMGLAAIDVIRNITNEIGAFEKHNDKLIFVTQNEIKLSITPFSLDGLPPAPKPYNAIVDDLFYPDKVTRDAFEESISKIANDSNIKEAPSKLIGIISPIIASKFQELKTIQEPNLYTENEIIDVIKEFLKSGKLEHKLILDHTMSTINIMKAYVAMSKGEKEPSLDFCAGQVWRHLQPIMYKVFSYSNVPNEEMVAIIKLDESTKRYSFGPPTESVEQLIALAEAGILNFVVADDPSIKCTAKGWILENGKDTVQANIMINTVLSPPAVAKVDSSLVKELLRSNLIQVVQDNMGIETSENGEVLSKCDIRGITLMGRLAKGTVFGVDAILECFGPRMEKWAVGAAGRLAVE